MKKKLLSLAAIAIIAVAAAVGVSKNANEVTFSDLTMANVEALAEGEGTELGCWFYCLWDPRYDCSVYDSTWGSLLHYCPDSYGHSM